VGGHGQHQHTGHDLDERPGAEPDLYGIAKQPQAGPQDGV